MIKASIDFSDLSMIPQWRDGRIQVGNSSIEPYAHHAIESKIVCTQGRWFVTIRERISSEFSTENQLEEVGEAQFEQAHQEALLWPLDYLMVEVAQAGCRIKLRSGLFGTAPVYYRSTEKILSVSYDLADFFSKPCLLDVNVASRRLAMHADYSAQQICAGIFLLTERSTLYARPGETRHQYPMSFEPTRPPAGTIADGSEFSVWLSDIMRNRTTGLAAVELSGGMDSATVACALGENDSNVTSLGIILERKDGQQVCRRNAIIDALCLNDLTVEMTSFPPSVSLQPSTDRLEYPLADFYLEAFEALWDKARDQGCNLLFTGIGGDQLFPLYNDEPQPSNPTGQAIASSAQQRAEALLTPSALEASRTLPGLSPPPGPLQASVLASNLCQSPHLLKRGLWPINPLGDPRLAAKCRQLPLACRSERETMRQYLRCRLGSTIFAPGYAKETFAQVLPALIASQATRIKAQLKECALADLRLVNIEAVMTLLNDLIRTRDRALTAPMASFLWMERFVRQFA